MAERKSNSLKSGEPTFSYGKVVGFHGLDGQVKVRPSTNNPEILEAVVHLRTKTTPQYPSTDLEIRNAHFDKRMFFLYFEGYKDRTSVEHIMGAELLAWEDELGSLSEDEFWVKELVGMIACKENGDEIGKVIDIIYSGNDLLEIRRENDPPGKTILVPFVKSIVPTVDMKRKIVVIKEIPGLLEAQ